MKKLKIPKISTETKELIIDLILLALMCVSLTAAFKLYTDLIFRIALVLGERMS